MVTQKKTKKVQKPKLTAEQKIAARVKDIMKRMSLEEKIGQLTQISGAPWIPGPNPEEVIRKGGAGSVLWLNNIQRFNELQKIAVEESPSGSPCSSRWM